LADIGITWFGRAYQRLDRYFFAPTSAQDLGYCRVAFCLWISLFYLPLFDNYQSQNISGFADVGEVFWQPIFPFNQLGIGVLPHPWIDWLVILWKGFLVTACMGVFTRTSLWGAFLLGVYCIGLPFNFGKISHNGGALVIAFGILAISRAGDAISLDSWWRRRRGAPTAKASGEYRWPIRFMWVLLACVYASSGLSKWLALGFQYLDPDTVAGFLRQRSFAWNSQPWTEWGYTFADYPWLCSAVGLGALLAESSFFLALVSQRARWVLLPALFFGHFGIAAVLGPRFFQFLALYVFWVPWTAGLERIRASRGG